LPDATRKKKGTITHDVKKGEIEKRGAIVPRKKKKQAPNKKGEQGQDGTERTLFHTKNGALLIPSGKTGKRGTEETNACKKLKKVGGGNNESWRISMVPRENHTVKLLLVALKRGKNTVVNG